jgi:hypothetical protein
VPTRERGSVTQCVGKKRYATYEFAKKKAEEFSKKYENNQRAYSCGICGGYHLTSKPK